MAKPAILIVHMDVFAGTKLAKVTVNRGPLGESNSEWLPDYQALCSYIDAVSDAPEDDRKYMKKELYSFFVNPA